MTAVLAAGGIVVRFGGVVAIDGVSFEVQPGELLGLIGPNGAGKTTMLRAIIGIVRPAAGSVTLEGRRIDSLTIDARIRAGLALSQQLVRPFREIDVRDNVAFAAGAAKTRTPLQAITHVDRGAERELALHALARVGIAPELASQSPRTQPLGVLKRLEMARALALKPKVLLLDEPLAGLNSREARALADTIADINRQGMTIVLIEHNLGEVMRICARLVVLDNGRKIADGAPEATMNDPVVRAAYLGGEIDAAA
jgi:branched-chain amino acid transport system ATP-binding protein